MSIYVCCCVCQQPSKHETLTQCWFNVGLAEQTVGQHCVNVSCLVRTLHIATELEFQFCDITSACDHDWLTRAGISLVISKRYRGTMMVLHLQCRPTIKPMPSKRYSIETSHVQREQTARPLGPDTHLLEV